ncbi:MAG: hypothetical protein EZS28_020336, partial [Streblomastix strix]
MLVLLVILTVHAFALQGSSHFDAVLDGSVPLRLHRSTDDKKSQNADPCYFMQGIYEGGVVYECLLTTPNDGVQNIVDNIKMYLENYAFLDTSINPPDVYGNAVDLHGELDKIARKSYIDGFTAYSDIMFQINRLKDPHTQFTPPCTNYFGYVIPYSLNFVRCDQSDNPPCIAHVYATKSPINGFTQDAIDLKLEQDILDKEITRIRIDGLPLSSSYTETAFETILKWSNEN